MEKELCALITAAKWYADYQSIGNGAILNVAIENAEKALVLSNVSESVCDCPDKTAHFLHDDKPHCNDCLLPVDKQTVCQQ
ncbi:hypothetical protein JYU20_00690 [Bacteroidales bacterium AH-315-I05]|nr:hypothetical protein [Bacteroidales bacterium AH-315-I05]